MSTSRKPKPVLMTFKIDQTVRDAFNERCQEEETSMSREIRKFIKRQVADAKKEKEKTA